MSLTGAACTLLFSDTGSELPDRARYSRIDGLSFAETATTPSAAPFRDTHAHAAGWYGSLTMLIMSKFTMSYILSDWSCAHVVARKVPSLLADMPVTAPTCERKCLTNSHEAGPFFQNLTCGRPAA